MTDLVDPASVIKPLTEKEFLAQVLELLTLNGWLLVDHQFEQAHYAKRTSKGRPDILAIRAPRVLFAEIKSEKGKLSPHQKLWLMELEQCPGVEVYCWRPSMWDDIVRVLQGA